jgi:uncharacterized protein
MQPVAATAPSSGIPVGLRKKEADDMTPEDWSGLIGGLTEFFAEEAAEPEHAEDDGGHAAGILFVDPDDKVLLLKRAPTEENYAGHWALPGGKAESGETPEQAARREAGEEIGPVPDGEMSLVSSKPTPNGMTFHTFKQQVDRQFEPKLNAEHTEHRWADADDLPEPLHPGVASTLAGDAGFEESQHHRDARGEFASEGAASGSGWSKREEDDFSGRRPDEHGGSGWSAKELDDFGDKTSVIAAADSALKIRVAQRFALDKATAREIDHDGHLHVKGSVISKAIVSPYVGKEIPGWEEMNLIPDKIYQLLRDPAELEKSAASFDGKPLLMEHKATDAKDHQTDLVIGAVYNPYFEYPDLKAELVVWPEDAIKKVEDKSRCEISCGYRYIANMTPGTFEGVPFDGSMTAMSGNHVILCVDGRVPGAVVADSAEKIQWAILEDALLHFLP